MAHRRFVPALTVNWSAAGPGSEGQRPAGVWTFCAVLRWSPELRRRAPARCKGQAGFWLVAGRKSRLRSRARLPFVPEARKKLAGGEAQRNHRKTRTKEGCAPAGRERRARRRHPSPRRRGIMGRPPGPFTTPWSRTSERCRGGFTTLAPRRGAGPGWRDGSGGSATLHHRLISCVPPARRGGTAGRTTGTERKCPNSRGPTARQPASPGQVRVMPASCGRRPGFRRWEAQSPVGAGQPVGRP